MNNSRLEIIRNGKISLPIVCINYPEYNTVLTILKLRQVSKENKIVVGILFPKLVFSLGKIKKLIFLTVFFLVWANEIKFLNLFDKKDLSFHLEMILINCYKKRTTQFLSIYLSKIDKLEGYEQQVDSKITDYNKAMDKYLLSLRQNIDYSSLSTILTIYRLA